jgi:hypothetical protein
MSQTRRSRTIRLDEDIRRALATISEMARLKAEQDAAVEAARAFARHNPDARVAVTAEELRALEDAVTLPAVAAPTTTYFGTRC